MTIEINHGHIAASVIKELLGDILGGRAQVQEVSVERDIQKVYGRGAFHPADLIDTGRRRLTITYTEEANIEPNRDAQTNMGNFPLPRPTLSGPDGIQEAEISEEGL
jgi:hypothetical protein